MGKTKNVLVLGAIAAFCDLVWEMEKLGINPILCDYYADAPAKKMGYSAYNVSTTDVKNLIKIARFHRVEGIVSAFSDRNLTASYELCKELGLPQFYNEGVIRLLTDKLCMKDFFVKLGVPVIRYHILEKDFLEEEVKQFPFPVVTKPIDAYGGKGIYVCRNAEEIKAVFGEAAAESLHYKDRIIVEEFYPVDEISVSAWVKGGKPYLTCIYDVIKNYSPELTLAAVSFPSKYTDKNRSRLQELLEKLVKAAGINEGPVTLQCFIGGDGIKISELLYRLAGGSPYLYATYLGGPNLARMLLQYDTAEELDEQNLKTFYLTEGDEVYFDIQIFIKNRGEVYYAFTEEEIRKKIKECVDVRVYHPSGSSIKGLGKKEQLLARAICKMTARDEKKYFLLLKRLEEAAQAFDANGERISFIKRPDDLRLSETFEVDWSFMEREGKEYGI